MTEWKCTVRTKSNYLQTVYVDAYNHQDAVAAVEARTGGECIMAVPEFSYDDSQDTRSFESKSDISSPDSGCLIAIIALVLLSVAWKWVLLVVGVGTLIWGLIHLLNRE